MKLLNIIVLCISLSGITIAQDLSFTMEISNDTVPEGNHFIVRYKLVNLKGEFTPPDFTDFQLIGGPMYQSMVSIVNGKTIQEYSYTYYLRPLKTGKLKLGKAKLDTDDDVKYTSESYIVSVENPDNIVISPTLRDDDNRFLFGFDEPLYRQPGNRKEEEKKTKMNIRRL